MKKLTTNSKLIGCLMGLSIVALGTGCTDSDYDLSSVDSTIGVGGEGLELPTSSTENIILDDVLKLNNSDFVKIAANGDYMFNKDGDEATPSHPYINKIRVEKANVNNNFRLHITLPSECRSTQEEAEQPRHGRGQAGRVPLHRCRLQRYPRIKRRPVCRPTWRSA